MSTASPSNPSGNVSWAPARSRWFTRRRRETGIRWLLALCASVSVLTTLGIVAMLVYETSLFFRKVSVVEFFFSIEWTPLLVPQHFGIWPLVCGTLWIAFGSAVVAIPMGLASAIYLSEYAAPRFRAVAKPVLEILAGVPSVVYGYFAVVAISPMVRAVFPSADVFNALSACLVVGVMVLPTVVSLSEDVLRSVPRSLREGAYALGSTPMDVTLRVVVPAGFSGIVAAFLLALSRAIGETMAVTLAAGATPNITLNPLESVQTMTAYIVQVSLGDTPTGTIEYGTIFAVGMTLFAMTLMMNLAAQWVLTRVREAYE